MVGCLMTNLCLSYKCVSSAMEINVTELQSEYQQCSQDIELIQFFGLKIIYRLGCQPFWQYPMTGRSSQQSVLTLYTCTLSD